MYNRNASPDLVDLDAVIFAFMKRAVIVTVLMVIFNNLQAQNILKVLVKSEDTKEVLPGASVFISTLKKGSEADSSGMTVIKELPDGEFTGEGSFIGYTSSKRKVTLPNQEGHLEMELEPASDEDNPDI